MRQIKNYTLPLVGTMIDWDTLSGSTSDPIRYFGPNEFLQGYTWPELEEDRCVRMSLIVIDPVACVATVDIEASEIFLNDFDNWLTSKSFEQRAVELGVSLLKRQ